MNWKHNLLSAELWVQFWFTEMARAYSIKSDLENHLVNYLKTKESQENERWDGLSDFYMRSLTSQWGYWPSRDLSIATQVLLCTFGNEHFRITTWYISVWGPNKATARISSNVIKTHNWRSQGGKFVDWRRKITKDRPEAFVCLAWQCVIN
jgi:hypothetical protein